MRLIDADELIRQNRFKPAWYRDSISLMDIENAPTACDEQTLLKQIPKKVKDARTVADLKIGLCPDCGDGSNSEFNYCPICGQRLDWRDEE